MFRCAAAARVAFVARIVGGRSYLGRSSVASSVPVAVDASIVVKQVCGRFAGVADASIEALQGNNPCGDLTGASSGDSGPVDLICFV